MRVSEVRIEGAERNLILRYSELGHAVVLQVCSSGWTDLQPPVPVAINTPDDAWEAATNAHYVCEGYEGTNADVQDYHVLFCHALR